MQKNKAIYVENTIQSDLQTLWQYTQSPDLHQQWDLRFTEIIYLPKQEEDAPQHFLYKTNIGFGLAISGKGESVGTIEKDKSKTSFLKFWSDNPISLIREGSGYWKYVPDTEGRISFFTRYDYQTRFGTVGRWVDGILFRPLMGWATAWSFDALRLWLEKGLHPKLSFRRYLTLVTCRSILCVDWIYQGLFPKLVYPRAGELQLLQKTQLFPGHELAVLHALGIMEMAFGLVVGLIGRSKRRAVYTWNIVLLLLLALTAIGQPETYVQPFNPVTLNLSMIALSLVGIFQLVYLPSAKNCIRKPQKGNR